MNGNTNGNLNVFFLVANYQSISAWFLSHVSDTTYGVGIYWYIKPKALLYKNYIFMYEKIKNVKMSEQLHT